MATISLTEFCPTCGAKQKMNRLMQKLGEDEVFCKEGHKFSNVESLVPVVVERKAKQAVNAAPAAETATAVADPPPNLEEVASPFQVFDEHTQQEIVKEIDEELDPEKIDKQLKDELPAEYPPTTIIDPPRTVYVNPQDTEKLPHGSIVLRVLVPDEFVSSLQATAEAMGKSTEEYFGEIIQHGLRNGWFW